jgi:hypothetical protein
VDPDPELVGQVGSGPGIAIALNPVLTFSTRKSVFFANCPYNGPLNVVKVLQRSRYENLSQFVRWPGLNFKE